MNVKTIESIERHSGDTGNGVLGMALAQAVATPPNGKKSKAAPAVNNNNNDLPDLSVSLVLSDEEMKAATEEAAKKKAWAENAGAIRRAATEELARIRSVEGWDLSPVLLAKVIELTEQVRRIDSAGDENLHRHVGFSEFLNVIRAVETEEQMSAVVRRLTTERVNDTGATRYRMARKDEAHRLKSAGTLPQGAFCWKEVWYLSYEPFDGEAKSPAQKAVEAEVNKAIRRLWGIKKKTASKKSEELHSLPANDDLSGILDSVAGLYRIKVDLVQNREKVIRYGGIAIIRLSDRGKKGGSPFAIEPVDGTGCFDWLSGQDGEWWIQVDDAIFGKVPWDPKKNETAKAAMAREEKWAHLSQERKDNGRRLARELNNVLWHLWVARKEAKAVKS